MHHFGQFNLYWGNKIVLISKGGGIYTINIPIKNLVTKILFSITNNEKANNSCYDKLDYWV